MYAKKDLFIFASSAVTVVTMLHFLQIKTVDPAKQ